MGWPRQFWLRVKAILRRRQLDRDLEDELQFHLAMREQSSSTTSARRRFGNVPLFKESCRDLWTFAWLEALTQDVRYGVRMMRKSSAFTAVAIASLGLGIGANTAMFSFFNAVLLKTLPVPHPEQLVEIRQRSRFGDNTAFGYPFFRRLERHNDVLDGMLARFPVTANLTSGDVTERVPAELVSGNYFRTLGVGTVIGRVLTEADDGAEGVHPVCVMSYDTWRERFGADPQILSRKILINARPFQVVGVTEAGFHGAEVQRRYELQIPTSMTEFFGVGDKRDAPGWIWLQLLGRLRPGITPLVAAQRLTATMNRIKAEEPARYPNEKSLIVLRPGSQGIFYRRGLFRDPILALMAVVGLVLLIACMNLAALLLARSAERTSELAVRLALGAPRSRLVRQLLVESLLLSLAGGGCGMVLAHWFTRALLSFRGNRFGAGALIDVTPDGLVLAFCLVLSIATGIAFGGIPAWQVTRTALMTRLRMGGNGFQGRRSVLRWSVVAGQIALSLVLVFGAGLFAGTLRKLRMIDLGFHPERIVLLSLNPEQNGYQQAETLSFYDHLLERVKSLPGVEAASLTDVSPLSGGMWAANISVPGHESVGDREPNNNFLRVTPEYFQTLGMPILVGRGFSDGDREGAQRVAIVNERFVAYYWPGQNPVGRHFKQGGWDIEIIGVTKTSKYQRMREDPQIIVYLPLAQRPTGGLTLHVRTALPVHPMTRMLQDLVRSLDPRLPVYDVQTLETQIDQALFAERLLASLSTFFSGVAGLLAAIGLYGVMTYTVAHRTREIGIRMALGAQSRQVRWLVMRMVVLLAGVGIAVGIGGCIILGRFVKSMLYGISPADLTVLAAATVLMAAVALVAGYLPARRAARVDPIAALRWE